MSEQKTLTFTARCKDFFGLHPGETITQFVAEMKALTPADKAEFHEAFNQMGLPTEPPKVTAA